MITRNILVAFACLLPASLHVLEPRIVKPTLDDSEVVVADLVLTDKPYTYTQK